MRVLIALLLVVPALASAQSIEALRAASSVFFDGGRIPVRLEASALAATLKDGTLSLSELAGLLKGDPAVADELLDLLIAKTGSLGAVLDTPRRRAELREALRRADTSILDRFPTLTAAQAAAAAALYASGRQPSIDPARPAELALVFPGKPVDPPKDAYLKPLGRGLLHGDETLFGAGAAWGDSKVAAEALNYLSANDPSAPTGFLIDAGVRHASIESWITSLLSCGHAVEVDDMRLYANFGDLFLETGDMRRDVATPTLIDTGLTLPSGRRLIAPATHSEIQIKINGPRVNALLVFFFGVDGRAAFRAQDTANQGWVGGRKAQTWSGTHAARLLERAGWVSRELAAKAKAFGLAMGGYGPLGDCNDGNAFVTGNAAYGMIRDPRYYAGDSELDRLSRTLPYDIIGLPDARRVWDSRAFELAEDTPLPDARTVLIELRSFLK